MRQKTLLILTTLFFLVAPAPLPCETLREALLANRIDPASLPASELDQKITSYAVLNNSREFLIAYYLDDGSGRLGDTLWLALQKKPEGTWLRRQLRRDERGVRFGGSVLSITTVGGLFYLATHVNPSASVTLILDPDLGFHDSIYGWLLGSFEDGLIIYQHSEIHFAPTHYVEISVYDLRQKKGWLIYPRKPYQPVRLEQIAKVRAEYQRRGEKWFLEHNHHGNPELFDNGLEGDFATRESDLSLIFRLRYDNTDTWEYSEKVKFQEFGGTEESLKEYPIADPLPEGLFAILGQALVMHGLNFQEDLVAVFKDDPKLSEMLRSAIVHPGKYGGDWRKYFDALDPRWGQPAVWQRLVKGLDTPPPTTDVICVFRHVDKEEQIEYREVLQSDFERKFGKRPSREYLEPALLNEIFAR